MTNQDLNHNALVQIMAETGMTMDPRTFFTWRATKQNTGQRPGFNAATILATDGLLGLFRNEETGLAFVGHIQGFDAKIENMFTSAKPISKKTREAVENIVDSLDEMPKNVSLANTRKAYLKQKKQEILSNMESYLDSLLT